MLGESAVLGGGGSSSGDAVTGGAAVGSNSGGGDIIEEGGGGGSFGGNRWPRQETLALLKIRSDMDVAFKDASVKGPLWEQVSRKMGELGYERSAKKCREKFENVYKYHKRTKDGRGGKSDGKTYRFFDQLEALENQPPPPQQPLVVACSTTTLPMPHVTVPSTTTPTTTSLPIPMPIATVPSYQPPPSNPLPPISFPNFSADLLSNSTSSSTSSDDSLEGRRKRKRKWKDFFDKLMKEVVEKQEQLHRRFLDAVEKRERDRMAREESWRAQEMQRITREREILAQERSISAAKDAAVMSFLQKIAEQHNLGQPPLTPLQQPQPQNHHVLQPNNATPQAATLPVQQQQQQPTLPVVVAAPVVQPVVLPQPVTTQLPSPTPLQQVKLPVTPPPQPPPPHHQAAGGMEIVMAGNNGENAAMTPGSTSSRWPKVEVQALIKLRTNLDPKYQENGPKGPLWEEISASMKRLGYNRSAKRCKEKWENINKYFKKVKESNKQRRQDSKTCPYFHELDAIYKEKSKHEVEAVKPESMVAPLMVRPEQQWPPQVENNNDPMDDEEEEDEERDMGDDEEDEEEELVSGNNGNGNGNGNGGGNYEIVANKGPATTTAATATKTSVGA